MIVTNPFLFCYVQHDLLQNVIMINSLTNISTVQLDLYVSVILMSCIDLSSSSLEKLYAHHWLCPKWHYIT